MKQEPQLREKESQLYILYRKVQVLTQNLHLKDHREQLTIRVNSGQDVTVIFIF